MVQDRPIYQDPSQSIEARVDDLISRMTLDEKVSQTLNDAPAIERLGIPAYDWWNECLHGVARAGIATVFSQAIGIAATWNTDLMSRVATTTSDEARAKHHEFLRQDDRSSHRHIVRFRRTQAAPNRHPSGPITVGLISLGVVISTHMVGRFRVIRG